MKGHKIILTWEAIYDIVDAEVWIYDYFGETRASKYRPAVRKELSDLTYQAGLFGDTHLDYRGYTIYKRPFSPAIIFYIIQDDGIHVLRILREEVDWYDYFKNHKDFEYSYPDKDYSI